MAGVSDWMSALIGETIGITTTGPVILGSFWYSNTGWKESVLMNDDRVPNLCPGPTRGGM